MIPKVSSMSEDEKNRETGIATDNPYYVTFQGVANHFPPQHQHPQAPSANYYQRQGYHVFPVYAVAEGRPVRERRLPCCGLGLDGLPRRAWINCMHSCFLRYCDCCCPWYHARRSWEVDIILTCTIL
ncbi:60S ribosomal protein L18a-like protein [Glycine soja]